MKLESNDDSLPGSQEKIQEYIKRVKNGEKIESFQLPPKMREAVEQGLESQVNEITNNIVENPELTTVPAQYEDLDSETLDFIWTIPEYVDPQKTRSEKERKARVIAFLKNKELEVSKEEERKAEDQEKAESIRQELGVSKLSMPESMAKDVFSEFRVKNGETDEGFFWNEYRNQKAKELKNEGTFEWGKERIYFDVSIVDCEKLRDLSMKIASEYKIPIAFKYIDNEKTFPVHKDGTETRFVANFATSEDARKFYQALSKSEEYTKLVGDRRVDYKGIRIDDLAEYASGFREKRGALERVLSATQNENGKYEYLGESGKKMTISADQYENFKVQYKQLEEAMEKEKKAWGLEEQGGK